MFKFFLLNLLLLAGLKAYAEVPCDIRTGSSLGIRVVEFVSGHTIHSKMPLREGTANALYEEMINLQDMGVCEEEIKSQKCILRFEKNPKAKFVTMYRAGGKWNSWNLKSKEEAQTYIKSLKKYGFCS